jgi:predicted TIM-barrel fold metal-dependent hydrolase
MLCACDTHVHIMGLQSDYPMAAERRYTPGLATVESLKAHLQGQGLDSIVLIQPSIYGFDNSCMLDALQELSALHIPARGVAVLPESVSMDEIKALDAQGVRGIRLNIESTGHFNASDVADQLQFWGTKLASVNWHIQVYAPMAWLASCEAVIAKSPVPVVLDHFALWTDATCTSPESQVLLRLLAAGHIYIKLSASYRVPIVEANALCGVAQRLLVTNPDRLLWGSDWPHTAREAGRGAFEISRFREIAPAAMRYERLSWLNPLGAQDWQQRVLVANPARLYGFI